mgnify:CR=1 FL=1
MRRTALTAAFLPALTAAFHAPHGAVRLAPRLARLPALRIAKPHMATMAADGGELRPPSRLAQPKAAEQEDSWLPPPKELKKVLPLGAMFFFILFNYTILRDTKDVLVVTAPGSGAEIIPFLKTYVNLPGAIAFTVLYSKLTNDFSRETVFNGMITAFIGFFAIFSAVIYPSQSLLHPTAWCAWLAGILPAGFAAPIAIVRNWTYALFYVMAELWGSVVVSLLFWGFANEVTTVAEAKKYYPLFGLGANVALIFSGTYVRYVSGLRRSAALMGAADPWGQSLKLLMGAVAAGGVGILGCFRYITTRVMSDPECTPVTTPVTTSVSPHLCNHIR